MAFGELQAIKTAWRLAGLSAVSGDSDLILTVTKRSYFIYIFYFRFFSYAKVKQENRTNHTSNYVIFSMIVSLEKWF